MLEIRDLRKNYGRVKALDGVSFEVSAGEILGLLGPNGAGKTTLVSLVAGLRRADGGSVRVDGIDASKRSRELQQRIGLAPQDLGIYPVVSVRNNLILFGEIAGMRGGALSRRIDEVAGAIGLTHLLDRRAGLLSGGEKRRLHTAMALLHRPALLLLDEPTAGADVRTRRDLLRLVKQLAAEGSAVLLSTHYLNEVETLNASAAILERGRLIAHGSVAGLISAHAKAVVELAFDGPAPELALGEDVVRNGSTLSISTDNAAHSAARALAALGAGADRLRSVQIINPSLESVFLALTGRRYSLNEEAAGENQESRREDVPRS